MKKTAISGIIVLISVSTLFRGLYFSYDTYAFLTGLALICGLYFIGKLHKNEAVYINKAILICGIVLVCSAALSFTKAVNPRENLDTVILYAGLLLISIVLYDFFHDNKQSFIKWLMIPAVTAGSICSAVGLTALSGYAVWEVTTSGNRIGSTFQYANTAAIYFVICLIFVLTLIDAVDNILLKALFSGMGGVIVFALLMTGSRGGYLVSLAIIILLLVLQPHGHRVRGMIGFASMLGPVFLIMKGFNRDTDFGDIIGTIFWITVLFFAAALSSLLINLFFRLLTKSKVYASPKGTGYAFSAVALISAGFSVVFRDRLLQLVPKVLIDRMARLIKLGLNDTNILYRITYNKDALKLIPGNWLTGAGGGGWKALYQSVQDFFYTAVFVHNNYLQVFVESGILGFGSFTALVLISLWNALRFYLRTIDPKLKTYCAGLLCALLALAVHSAADFDLSFTSLSLLFWMMFTASAIKITSKEDETAPADKNTETINSALEECSAAAEQVPNAESVSAAPVLDAGSGKRYSILTDTTMGRYTLTFMTIACSVLFTVNALHFTAAQNAQKAFDYGQAKDYRSSLAYYEEAERLDASNTKYSFELAKLYRYFAGKSGDESTRSAMLEKARTAAEKSIAGDRNYPAYMNTLVRIYLDSDMPLEALKYSRELIENQKYYAENYELLAGSYIAAADYYAGKGDKDMAEELFTDCIAIAADPYLQRSVIDSPVEVNSGEAISAYKHSGNLSKYLKEAETRLDNLRSRK